MSQLFKKAALFTDLHLGAKSNSQRHINDCDDYINWFIKTAKENNCDTGIFLGDFHHNRNNINVLTLTASIKILEKLGGAFDQFYFFPGNHDLFFKDKRQVHSVEYGIHIPGVNVLRDITTLGDCCFVPWLIGDEWKQMSKIKSRYVFGHFELPHFMMNAMVKMPDNGDLQPMHFKHPEYVFSGHFHKRQVNSNIIYIGNAFPHNYSDAGDDDRGMTILEHGGEPEFINWEQCPKYRTCKLSELIDSVGDIKSNSHYRVDIDIPINFEEASFIKETFMKEHHIRELVLIPEKKSLENDTAIEIEKFESIDTIVHSQLTAINSKTYSPELLLEIYNNL